MKDWFETYFDEDYFKLYSILLTPEVSRKESVFVAKALGLRKGMKIMDLACGQGRISINLAKSGYKVTGVDLSAHLLGIAKRDAARRNVKVRFIRKDMRRIAFKGEFDAVICMLTSFGYFNDRENKDIVRKVALSLKRGGKFLLDVGNPEWLIGNLKPHAERRIGDMMVEENRSISVDNKHVKNAITYSYPDNGKSRTVTTEFRQYSEAELRKMLGACGLSVHEVFGDYDVSKPLTSASKRLLVVSEKVGGG
jgi:SAM-dependent methyltransferase